MSLVITSSLGEWRGEWDTLAASAPLPSPFLQSWWLEGVSKDRSTYLLVVEQEELVGGLALERMRFLPIFRFVGSGVLCPDHLDIVAKSGRESEVLSAVAEWFERPGMRILDLDGLAQNSFLATAWENAKLRPIDVAPWVPLPSEEGEYLSARSNNFRRNVRKTRRRLQRDGVIHQRVETADLDAAMQWFTALHAGRPGRAALINELPRLTRALRSGMAQGEVRVDQYVTDERVIALTIFFAVAGRLSFYQNARQTDYPTSGIGIALHVTVIEDATDDGCHEMDMLRGAEAYKSSMTTQRRQLFGMRVAHGRPADVALWLWFRLESARHVAGRIRRSQRVAGFSALLRRGSRE